MSEEINTVVIARTPQEMSLAQSKLTEWAVARLSSSSADLAELQANLSTAKKSKWKTSTLVRQVQKAEKKVQFYEKIGEALKAGYVIVPNFPVDVFAVRTTKQGPPLSFGGEHKTDQPQPSANVRDIGGENPKLGKGAYVSPIPVADVTVRENPDHNQKNLSAYKYIATTTPTGFDDVDFPFALAKPQILEDSSRAMALKMFDDLGVLPASRKGDPMVVGRIKLKQGYSEKIVSFLVTWWVDTRAL